MIPKVILNEKDLALIFDIREETVIRMAVTNQLPYSKKNNKMFFEFSEILSHFEQLERSIA